MLPEIMKSIPLQNPWMQSIQWNSKTTNPAIEPILFSNILQILNVSKDTVSKWELDERNPSGPSARLIQILERNPEALLKA